MSDELTAPVLKQDDEKRIVFGPVLVPDEPDSDGDVVTAEKIEEVAHKFMSDYGNIDLQHSLNNVGKVVESYVTHEDNEFSIGEEVVSVPKGSWMMGVKVTDDDSWQAVKSGSLTGFSIMGIPKFSLKSKKEGSANKNAALKRTTLSDLGDDFEVNAISLVDQPAVPKGKWVAIKSKAKDKEPVTKAVVQKALEGSLEDRKRLVERKMDDVFYTMEQVPFIHATYEDYFLMRVHDDYGDTKMMQVPYSIDEEGTVSISGEPFEVRIEENVVPVESSRSIQMKTMNQEGTEPETSHKSVDDSIQEGIKAVQKTEQEKKSNDISMFAKAMKALGFPVAEKAGRTISDDNYRRLGEVKEIIDDLYQQADQERAEKSAEGEGQDMKDEEVRAIIKQETGEMKEMLEKALKQDSGEEASSQKEGKDEDEDDEEGEENEKDESKKSSEKSKKKAKKSEEPEEDEDEVVLTKSQYEELTEKLDKATKSRPALSHRIAGHDEVETAEKSQEEAEPERDAFGFKR